MKKKAEKAIAVIGEGITEKYYIESLKKLSRFTVLPKELGKKASSLIKLETSIKDVIELGYDELYCLIDMDSKSSGENKIQYERLKAKYHGKTLGKKKKGISCKVEFIETERCTELWFIYHFTKSAITREFTCYDEVEKELKKYRPDYGKHDAYFKSVDLHKELTIRREPKGSLKRAIENAKQAEQSRQREDRKHTYTEMYKLIEGLGIAVEQD